MRTMDSGVRVSSHRAGREAGGSEMEMGMSVSAWRRAHPEVLGGHRGTEAVEAAIARGECARQPQAPYAGGKNSYRRNEEQAMYEQAVDGDDLDIWET